MYKGKELPFALETGDVMIMRNEFQPLLPRTYLSTAIRVIDGSWYNHSGLVVVKDGVPYLNEAVSKGIVQNPIFDVLDRGKSYVAFLRPKFAFDKEEFAIEADSYVGYKYDYTSLVYHQLVYRMPKLLRMDFALNRKGKWIGRTKEDASAKMVCSEYIGRVFNLPNWWLLSTGDIVNDRKFNVVWEEKKFLLHDSMYPSWETNFE